MKNNYFCFKADSTEYPATTESIMTTVEFCNVSDIN